MTILCWAGHGQAMSTMDHMASQLGFAMEPSKVEGPCKILSFLGIELDTVKMELRLPESKLGELRQLLGIWCGKRRCFRQELESLVGKLQHACRVMRPGRCFMHRFYALLKVPGWKSMILHLNRETQMVVWWWHAWLADWNGFSMMWNLQKNQPDKEVWTDAAGSWGCGGWWKEEWFQFEWSVSLRESLAMGGGGFHCREGDDTVVIAAAIWGPKWAGKVVRFHSDNMAVVCALNRVYSASDPVMHLVRCLVFLAARHGLLVCGLSYPGHGQRSS